MSDLAALFVGMGLAAAGGQHYAGGMPQVSLGDATGAPAVLNYAAHAALVSGVS